MVNPLGVGRGGVVRILAAAGRPLYIAAHKSGRGRGQRMRDLAGHYIEDLVIGMSAITSKTVTDADVVLFSGITGDMNPVHHDSDYAATTRFGDRIVHGMLTAGLVSAVLGTKLPGPGCIYMSQSLHFRAPVKVGETVVARVTVTGINLEKKRATLSTICRVGDAVVVEGDALMLVPSRAASECADGPLGAASSA